MKRSSKAIACGSLIVAAQVVGAQPQSAAVIARHQLSECMSKQMSADRSLSYNDAMRLCKQRLQPPKDTLASINPTDSGTKAH
ncbi:MAG TPA: hypothetical protein VK693_02405 [Steroidobacteraceae bacterium]|nr:hypothetical protein [Steroidobacteraceae bacterium]